MVVVVLDNAGVVNASTIATIFDTTFDASVGADTWCHVVQCGFLWIVPVIVGWDPLVGGLERESHFVQVLVLLLLLPPLLLAARIARSICAPRVLGCRVVSYFVDPLPRGSFSRLRIYGGGCCFCRCCCVFCRRWFGFCRRCCCWLCFCLCPIRIGFQRCRKQG